MTTHIALLRAINVGGNAAVKMADLRDLMSGLGFSDVRTPLQTGNLVFSGAVASGTDLETLIETTLEKELGLATTVVARTVKTWAGMVRDNPFADEAKDDPSYLPVMPLRTAPRRRCRPP